MQRAMIKQLHTFWLTLTISTTVFALLLTAVVMLVRELISGSPGHGLGVTVTPSP